MRLIPSRISFIWVVLCFFSLLLTAVVFPPAAAAATDIGKVIAFTPGASVLREGKTEAVALHAGIMVSDTIQTDGTGRVKILFNDDSSISIGPNTTMDMNEYADEGSNPTFGVYVVQGVIRTITGRIVDQNPDGFKITTPEVTVGIRGTIVSLLTGNGVSTVYVENTLRQVYVNNIRVPSGHKITIPGDTIMPEPILPQDRRKLGMLLALLGGNGVVAAAPEPSGVTETEHPLFTSAAYPDTSLTDIALGTQILGDAQRSANARVSGTLTSNTVTLAYNNFSFMANLLTGAISSAEMAGAEDYLGSSIGISFSVSGGSGNFVAGSGATIDGFSGTYWSGGPAIVIDPTDITILTLSPSSDLGSFSPGSVSGIYQIGAGGSPVAVDDGTILGERVQ